MTNVLSPVFKQKFWDNNGNPLVGGTLTSYAAGTTTPIATYNATGGTNTNPIVLNARGECDCWILPNVSYKFLLQDSLGNTIPGWPIDNVINSQLTTLYGGVDTGAVNAYVINFAANFSSYTDGTVIYWIASNTNTGASTININGIGVINLVNQNGSALAAGQVQANLVSSILIKGGQALLLGSNSATSVLAIAGNQSVPSIAFYDTGFLGATAPTGFYLPNSGEIGIAFNGVAVGLLYKGTVTLSVSGLSSPSTVQATFSLFMNGAFLVIPNFSGTSNSTSFSVSSTQKNLFVNGSGTTPAQWFSIPAAQDNTSSIYGQVGYIALLGSPTTTGVQFVFMKNNSATGWTSSGTKGIGDITNGGALVIAYTTLGFET